MNLFFSQLKATKKRKSHVSFLSTIYILVFYYNVILNFLTFRPLIVNITENPYHNVDLFYFPNQNCAYIWKNESESTEIEETIFFYINGFEGNCSTRFNIIKQLQHILPNHVTIVQFDLSGFGNSSQTECNLAIICHYLLENINYFMENCALNSKYVIFTENEGIVPVARILPHLQVSPLSLILLNAKSGLFDYMISKYGLYTLPFYFSYFFDKTIEDDVKKFYKNSPHTNFLFLRNDDFQNDFYNSYFDFDFVSPMRKKMLTINGKGPTSLIVNENFQKLETFFQSIS